MSCDVNTIRQLPGNVGITLPKGEDYLQLISFTDKEFLTDTVSITIVNKKNVIIASMLFKVVPTAVLPGDWPNVINPTQPTDNPASGQHLVTYLTRNSSAALPIGNHRWSFKAQLSGGTVLRHWVAGPFEVVGQ